MAKGGEPRAKTIGKCVSCGLVVREGDEMYDVLFNLFHSDCDHANRRELARWNADVKKDREARSHANGAVRKEDEATCEVEEGEGKETP